MKKTDEELPRDVRIELLWEPSVTSTHVGVSVKDGVVTVTGHVPSYLEKLAAERAAKRVAGVRAVGNEIHVKLPGSTRRTDEDIAAAAGVEVIAARYSGMNHDWGLLNPISQVPAVRASLLQVGEELKRRLR